MITSTDGNQSSKKLLDCGIKLEVEAYQLATVCIYLSLDLKLIIFPPEITLRNLQLSRPCEDQSLDAQVMN
jgi:hypothetical protein